MHNIDRNLMTGDWYCYGKSTVGSPSTLHTSTSLHTEMSVQSLQTDTKLWRCPCGCHSGMHLKWASEFNNKPLLVILIFITLSCSLSLCFCSLYSFSKNLPTCELYVIFERPSISKEDVYFTHIIFYNMSYRKSRLTPPYWFLINLFCCAFLARTARVILCFLFWSISSHDMHMCSVTDISCDKTVFMLALQSNLWT